jgi:hypothetical protein
MRLSNGPRPLVIDELGSVPMAGKVIARPLQLVSQLDQNGNFASEGIASVYRSLPVRAPNGCSSPTTERVRSCSKSETQLDGTQMVGL